MNALKHLTLVGGTVTTGLIAGLFYAYSCSVMLGLAKVDDRTFVEVMQRINVAIINPAFMFCFMGTVVIVGAAAFFNRGSGALKRIVAGLVLYIVALIVTFAFDIHSTTHSPRRVTQRRSPTSPLFVRISSRTGCGGT